MCDKGVSALGRFVPSGTRPASPYDNCIAVIIPCFNHAHFLGDAIESVLRQDYRPLELLVIDDGSTDETEAVARRYPDVRYLRQPHRGLAAARNTGLHASRGRFLLFLDADDRLLADGLATHRACLGAHPEWAFVSGGHRYIDVNGRSQGELSRDVVHGDHYERLLEGNYIGMHATVLYRREVFHAVGAFSEALPACEDYEMYLRIARRFAVGDRTTVVAEYRRYGSAMSDDLARMLRASVTVLRSQQRFVRGDPRCEAAYASGLARWRMYYGRPLASQIRTRIGTGGLAAAAGDALALLRYAPREFFHMLRQCAGLAAEHA